MAIDVYLQIDGIKGESTDNAHKDWIECKSVQWEVLQPKSATASTGDVQVRPVEVLGEAREEAGGGDGAGLRPTDIGDVGEGAVQLRGA